MSATPKQSTVEVKPFIAVLIPTRGLIFTKTMLALQRELAPYDHAYFMTTDLPLPDCRNKLVEAAIGSKLPFTHYLMVDDDNIVPVGGLQAMLASGLDVAVIDYPTHWGGKAQNTGTAVYDEWKEGDKVEGKKMLWAGLGCTLTKASVFDSLKKPFFRKGGQIFDRDKNGKIVLYGIGGGDGGEDYEFFFDCRAKGLTVDVVHGFIAGHAKVIKQVGVITSGKYVHQHEITINDQVDRPLK
jgi:hypothetical protein